jgi:hypothetical protein
VIPACYNRPPTAEGRWLPTGRMRVNLATPWPARGIKPVYRWHPRWFVDRCATWDGTGIGPDGQRFPEAHGFDCAGCRWEPAHRRQAREFEARMRTPVDNPADNRGVIPNVRRAALERAAEHVCRTGQAVLLTCADQVVGRVGPALQPGAIYPDEE